MKKNKYILFICAASLLSFALPQDVREYLLKMNNNYSSATSVNMGVEVKMYINASDKTPKNLYTGKTIIEGSNYYSDLMGMRQVINKKYAVIVDDESKMIMLFRSKDAQKKGGNTQVDISSAIDSMLTSYQLKTISNDGVNLKLSAIPKGESLFEKMEADIDVQKNLLKQITYYYKKETDITEDDLFFAKVEVCYTNIKLNEPVAYSVFDESGILKITEKNVVVANKKYAGYNLINQLDQSKSLNIH